MQLDQNEARRAGGGGGGGGPRTHPVHPPPPGYGPVTVLYIYSADWGIIKAAHSR